MAFSNEILIRPMAEADIDKALLNFEEQGWNKGRRILERYLSGQTAGKLFAFAAQLGSDIAGYTVLYRNGMEGSFANQNMPCISDLIVFSKYQRRGIAWKIMEAAEEKAAEFGDIVYLGVGLHSGYGAAQRLYVKRGYLPDGTGVWFNGSRLEEYADCKNDDSLILYFSKEL